MPATRAYKSKHNSKHIIYDDGDTKRVYADGSRAWRTNNPGNLKARGGFAGRHGAIGSDGVNAIFPDYQTGKDAMVANLQRPDYTSLSINNMIAKYAPARDGNNVPAYQRYVHDETGLDMSRIFGSLNPEEFRSVVDALESYEHSDPGQVWVMDRIEATKSKNDKNFTDFKVNGDWISKSAAMAKVKEDRLDAVISGDHLRPSPGQPDFESLEEEATDEEEGEDPKHKDRDDR